MAKQNPPGGTTQASKGPTGLPSGGPTAVDGRKIGTQTANKGLGPAGGTAQASKGPTGLPSGGPAAADG